MCVVLVPTMQCMIRENGGWDGGGLYFGLLFLICLNCKCALPSDDCTFHILHHNTRQNGICISLPHTVFEFDGLDRNTLFYIHRYRVMFGYTIDLLCPECPICIKKIDFHKISIIKLRFSAIFDKKTDIKSTFAALENASLDNNKWYIKYR